MRVRSAKVEDSKIISDLMAQLGYDTIHELISSNINSFKASSFDKVYVAERNNEIVGVISCHIISLFHQLGFCGRITSLAVSKSARGEGIGKALVQRAWLNMVSAVQRTRVAAYGLIREHRKILLCRISKELPEWEGQWTLPGGGLDFGESPEAAMVREVGEETGLSVQATAIAGIDSLHDKHSEPAFHGIRIIYRTNLIGGLLRNELVGTTDLAKWVHYDELKLMPLVDVAKYGVELAFDDDNHPIT